ncbi:MAG TPA: hypothetical protein VHA78_00480 [Candidatus Peribacteraceae bacterium]|nr:hypothetical protein [Candidatus Peribacteraceae bacterium]
MKNGMLVLLWIALLAYFFATMDTNKKEARLPFLTVALMETVGNEHVYAIERNTPDDMVTVLRQRGYECHTGSIPSVVVHQPCFTLKGPLLFGDYASFDVYGDGYSSWPPGCDCMQYKSEAEKILSAVFSR